MQAISQLKKEVSSSTNADNYLASLVVPFVPFLIDVPPMTDSTSVQPRAI